MLGASRASLAIRASAVGAAGPSRLATRSYSLLTRPSARALGKQPEFSRHRKIAQRSISWLPWKQQTIANDTPSSSTSNIDGLPTADIIPEPVAGDTASLDGGSNQTDTITSSPTLDTSAAPEPLTAADHLVVHPGNNLSEVVAANPDIPLQELLRTPEAVHAPAKAVDLASIGLDHGMFGFPGWVSDALVNLHNLTGLPWWATIATVTMALRLCLLRPLIESNKHNVRFAAVAPELRECQEQIKRATDTGDVQGRQIAVKHFQQVLVNNDVNPLRSLKLPIIQIPIFMVMFFALRRLAENPFPQFIEGGFSWVTDLTVPDPFYILPVTSMLFQNLVLRYGADTSNVSLSKSGFQLHMKNIFAALSVPILWFVSNFPAALLFYWTTANAFTLFQSQLLKAPAVKRLLKFPTPKISPGSVPPQKEPTMMETWSWVKETLAPPRGLSGAGGRARTLQHAPSSGFKRETIVEHAPELTAVRPSNPAQTQASKSSKPKAKPLPPKPKNLAR